VANTHWCHKNDSSERAEPKECKHKLHTLQYTAHLSNIVTLTQVQLKPAYTSDSVLTSLSHLQIFLYWWTYVVIMPVDLQCQSTMEHQHIFCEQCCCLRVVKTQHLLQHCVNHTDGSNDCACNSIYWVCHRNTSTQNRVVLNIIHSAMKNYTQLWHKVFTSYSHIFHICLLPLVVSSVSGARAIYIQCTLLDDHS